MGQVSSGCRPSQDTYGVQDSSLYRHQSSMDFRNSMAVNGRVDLSNLSMDKQTELRYDGGETVTIGTRALLSLLNPHRYSTKATTNNNNQQQEEDSNNRLEEKKKHPNHHQNNNQQQEEEEEEEEDQNSFVSDPTWNQTRHQHPNSLVGRPKSHSLFKNNLLHSHHHHSDFIKRIGVVLKTCGNRFFGHSVVMLVDFYRLENGRFVQKSHLKPSSSGSSKQQKQDNYSSDSSEVGPAEGSCCLRVGDILYAVNGRLIVNKSKSQILKMINTIIANEAWPLVLTWRHSEALSNESWETEKSIPPPRGNYFTSDKFKDSKDVQPISSVSI